MYDDNVKVNSLGACVGRDPESGLSMDAGGDVPASKKGGGGGGSEKAPSLSIDRAAFLILRVKKAFKKKRQQRKDRQ